MSQLKNKNYGLRPRSEMKGKYREMIGVSRDGHRDDEKVQVEAKNEKKRRICYLPLVITDENALFEGNTLELEIADPDNPILTDLTTNSVADNDISNSSTKKEDSSEEELTAAVTIKSNNALQRIEEILKKNDQLIESMKEGPMFRKRKRIKEESTQQTVSVQVAKEEQESEISEDNDSQTFLAPSNLSLTPDMLKEMMCRELSAEELSEVNSLLQSGRSDLIVERFLGPDNENRFRKCLVCHELIQGSDENYAAHYSEAHNSEPSFICEICGIVNNSSEMYHTDLQEHFQMNINSRASKLEELSSRQDHTGNQDALNESCICDICGKKLKHQKSLYSHRRTHTDAKAVCHICGATLKSSRYLHHHLLLHKNVEKPHKCNVCGKAFFSSSALKVHHYYNHEETPGRFQCNMCGKNFKAKQGLQFHMDSHSSELRYECSYCHKRFRGFKTCRVHELRHREANEPGKFNCPICGKTFKTRQTLKNHEDVHASFNRYQCSICEKRFKLRKSCLAHIRVHHSERDMQLEVTTADEGEVAVGSLLAEGDEYVVTLEESDVQTVHLGDVDYDRETVELVVPEAHVECEIPNFS